MHQFTWKQAETICVNCCIQINVRMWFSRELFPHRLVLSAFHQFGPVFFFFFVILQEQRVLTLSVVYWSWWLVGWVWFVWRLVFIERHCCFSSKHCCRKTRASLDVLQTIATKMNGTVCVCGEVKKVSRCYFIPKSMNKINYKIKLH